MSDTEAAKGKTGWTDRQRLVYFFNLVDFSKTTLDYNNAPRPEGKSVGACKIMVHRLKNTLKDDLEALKAGNPIEEHAPKKPASTPRKRKGKDADANGEEGASPTKKGRKKKGAAESPEQDVDEQMKVKDEVQGHDIDEEMKVKDEVQEE
ncbi:hypothetical protein FB567DRAFT_625821 [Paraphoma chrysanthemicola]|uniref:Uncharacterized protein n=1 Tax=Paraphoma chrysanthemicola TaxID=798071 RepID=A0A8K0RBA1_9PLEO|nr:hypothetical protein FB567DRAFT_625821 [Paraphoma chrysanthemicola]